MLRIIGKEIDLDQSPVLYSEPVSAAMFARDWKIRSGEWWVDGDWINGRNPHNNPGMIVSHGDFKGNVLVDFEARTVLPSTHDINFMWNGSWDETLDRRDVAYVFGLEGWWDGKVGFEKSPEYKLVAGTPLFDFAPGRIYRLQGGSIDGHCFLFVDGQLVLEITDPDPIDSQRYAKVGFEAYASHIQIRNIQIRSLTAWQTSPKQYAPEF
ncbi:MAG: hypothetical protein U0X20_00970 [Caldilineaceae bacterium]